MRITKKQRVKLGFTCLISLLSSSVIHAETTLSPVTPIKLKEAPPPWAARADLQTPTAEPVAEEKPLDISAANVETPMDNTASETTSSDKLPPLTLEGNFKNMQSLDDSFAEKEAQTKKKGLLSKLFSHKKKQKPAKTQAANSIENWYQNRRNASLASNNLSVENLKAQASQGDSNAQYQLGLLYQTGNGVEENIYQAIHWLTRAANANHVQAQYALAMLYRENASKPGDEQRAVNWYRRAAQAGNADAQYSLGLLYANGDMVTQDAELAKKWFRLSAEQGNMAAKIALMASENPSNSAEETSLAEANNTATPAVAEPEEAPIEIAMETPLEIKAAPASEITTPSETHFANTTSNTVAKAAAEEPQEQIRVASVTAPTPRPIEKKEETQKAEPQQANQNKHSASPSTVEQTTSLHDIDDADIDVASIKRGAMAGDAESQLLLGSLYEDGRAGMPQDYKMAAKWYRKSADQGFAQAQYNLALLYEDGKGMEQDYYEAAQWYKRAANNGFAEAQNNLGVLYILGKGVIKDRNRAELMFRRSAEQGNENAKRNLKMLLRSTAH